MSVPPRGGKPVTPGSFIVSPSRTYKASSSNTNSDKTDKTMAPPETSTEVLTDLTKVFSRNVDLSAASLVEVFKGDSTGPSVKQFFAQIDQAALIGQWKKNFKVVIVRLKVKGPAETFITSKYDFDTLDGDGLPSVDYDIIKKETIERFEGRRTGQYHYANLTAATQGKGETVAMFAERVRHLGNLTVRKVDDATKQATIVEECEIHMLQAFLNGLAGKPGEITRYSFPTKFEAALETALMVEAQEKCRPKEESAATLYAVQCYSCNEEGHVRADCPKEEYRNQRQPWQSTSRGRSSTRGNRGYYSQGNQESQRFQQRRSYSGCDNCKPRSYSPGADRGGRPGINRSISPYRGRESFGLPRNVRFQSPPAAGRGNNSNSSFWLARTECFRCGRLGHLKRECRVNLDERRETRRGSSENYPSSSK